MYTTFPSVVKMMIMSKDASSWYWWIQCCSGCDCFMEMEWWSCRERFSFQHIHSLIILEVNTLFFERMLYSIPWGVDWRWESKSVWLYPFQPSVSITLLNQMFAVKYKCFLIHPLLTCAIFNPASEKDGSLTIHGFDVLGFEYASMFLLSRNLLRWFV